MKKYFHSRNFFFLIIVLNALSCDSTVTRQGIKLTHRKDPEHKPVATTDHNTSFVMLTRENIQYIDLMVADDAMVEIYYKDGAGILEYIEEIKTYLKTKRTGIKVIAVAGLPQNIKPEGRLYIHDTGDHRYVLYIF